MPDVQPMHELGGNGPVRDALEALTTRGGRDESGRFTAGNTGALRTGEHSAALWNALEPAKRDVVERVRADLGVTFVDATQTLSGVIDAYAEAHLLRSSMFIRLVEQGGPVTAKGKQRALYAAYARALDQELKLAQLLGLERKSRGVNLSPADYSARARAAAAEERGGY